MKTKPNGKHAKLKQAFDLIKKHKAQFDGRFIKYQKKIKTGAWITFIYEDPSIEHEGFVSFGEYSEGRATDSYGFLDERIFYHMTEKELKNLLKTGEVHDEFKVLSIDEYTYTYRLTILSPNE